MTKGKLRTHYLPLLTVGVVLAAVPLALGGSSYWLRIATMMLVFMGLTVGFNIIFGHTGQLFLCVGALAGSAAYVSVVMTDHLAIAWWITLPLGVVLAVLIGGLFSYISVRRGLGAIFLGIVTLAFSLVFQNMVLGLRKLTGGETGIVTKQLGPELLHNLSASYYLFLVLLMAALVLYQFLVRSNVGLAFRALSDDELSAELSGVDVTRHKVLAAAIGSGVIGLMATFYVYYNGFINPDIFTIPHIDVVVLVMLIFGGRGTLVGPILGGIVFTVINDLVRPLGPLTLLVYGVIMVGLFLVFREGVVVAVRRALKINIP